MKILLAASECDPFAKVGGLGDVIPALATELKKLGHDIRIVLPKYGSINFTSNSRTVGGPLYVNMGYGLEFAKVLETQLNEININLTDILPETGYTVNLVMDMTIIGSVLHFLIVLF